MQTHRGKACPRHEVGPLTSRRPWCGLPSLHVLSLLTGLPRLLQVTLHTAAFAGQNETPNSSRGENWCSLQDPLWNMPQALHWLDWQDSEAPPHGAQKCPQVRRGSPVAGAMKEDHNIKWEDAELMNHTIHGTARDALWKLGTSSQRTTEWTVKAVFQWCTTHLSTSHTFTPPRWLHVPTFVPPWIAVSCACPNFIPVYSRSCPRFTILLNTITSTITSKHIYSHPFPPVKSISINSTDEGPGLNQNISLLAIVWSLWLPTLYHCNTECLVNVWISYHTDSSKLCILNVYRRCLTLADLHFVWNSRIQPGVYSPWIEKSTQSGDPSTALELLSTLHSWLAALSQVSVQ